MNFRELFRLYGLASLLSPTRILHDSLLREQKESDRLREESRRLDSTWREKFEELEDRLFRARGERELHNPPKEPGQLTINKETTYQRLVRETMEQEEREFSKPAEATHNAAAAYQYLTQADGQRISDMAARLLEQ